MYVLDICAVEVAGKKEKVMACGASAGEILSKVDCRWSMTNLLALFVKVTWKPTAVPC